MDERSCSSDECLRGIDNCDVEHAMCKDTPGSFLCLCVAGFTGNGTSCNDVDECDYSVCPTLSAICANQPGSYTCTCRDGFISDGHRCHDVDECHEMVGHAHHSYLGSHIFQATATTCAADSGVCTNTRGSFTCTCQQGFSGDGIACSDVDECSEKLCDPIANCTNLHGSYRCACPAGYRGTNRGTRCWDLNECSLSSNRYKTCATGAKCTNTRGSYECACKSGYSGDGHTYCDEINECTQADAEPCNDTLLCVNTPYGSYSCAEAPTGAAIKTRKGQASRKQSEVSHGVGGHLPSTSEEFIERITPHRIKVIAVAVFVGVVVVAMLVASAVYKRRQRPTRSSSGRRRRASRQSEHGVAPIHSYQIAPTSLSVTEPDDEPPGSRSRDQRRLSTSETMTRTITIERETSPYQATVLQEHSDGSSI